MFLVPKNGAEGASGQGFRPLEHAQDMETSLSTWTEPWTNGSPFERDKGERAAAAPLNPTGQSLGHSPAPSGLNPVADRRSHGPTAQG